MRLAILCQSFGRFGGAEYTCIRHYNSLRKMKKDVTLFYGGSESLPATLDDGNIKNIPSSRAVKDFLRFVISLRDFDKILIHHHVEPVLAHILSKRYSDKTIWYSGSMLELPWSRHITGLDYRSVSQTVAHTASVLYGRYVSRLLLKTPFYQIAADTLRWLDTITVRSFSRIIANSKFLSNFLRRIYKLGTTPPVVYPGYDDEMKRIALSTHANGGKFLLAVGALTPLKNIGTVIEALSLLERSPTLVLVGDGPENSFLRLKAKKLGVRLLIKGWVTPNCLAKLYASSSLLVHLSLYEPYGLTPLEAALFGKPAVVTNYGGVAETVLDGVTGKHADPRDPRDVAAKINLLLSDEVLRKRMGENARKRAMQFPSSSEAAEQIWNLLEA